jgi:hypothetical protein
MRLLRKALSMAARGQVHTLASIEDRQEVLDNDLEAFIATIIFYLVAPVVVGMGIMGMIAYFLGGV